jgi:hypothetical protein
MSPYESEDLTEIIDNREDQFLVLQSPQTAEHAPDYVKIATFSTLEQAEAYLKGVER